MRYSRLVLLGHPVSHSLSPRLHGAALREAGIPLTYEALDVAPRDLSATLDALCAEGAAGNVTIPHKVAVRERCETITDVARAVGAVNTFWTRDGRLVGDNTDVPGFDMGARELLSGAGRGLPARVALIGAGGAAAAVAYACSAWGETDVAVFARRPDRAEALAQRFDRVRAVSRLEDALESADLVVNATPIGLYDDALPVDPALLAWDCAVFDLVYRDGETAWTRAARLRGHPARDGIAMLVEQAAAAFERWFDVPPSRRVMWEALT